MAERKRTTQSEVAAQLNDLAHLNLLNLGDVSALNNVIMDYFTSRDEGSDDEVTKEEESDDSLLYAQVCCARFSKCKQQGTLFMLAKHTSGDQKFRDYYAYDKQRKTVLFRVTLVCLCNDAV